MPIRVRRKPPTFEIINSPHSIEDRRAKCGRAAVSSEVPLEQLSAHRAGSGSGVDDPPSARAAGAGSVMPLAQSGDGLSIEQCRCQIDERCDLTLIAAEGEVMHSDGRGVGDFFA